MSIEKPTDNKTPPPAENPKNMSEKIPENPNKISSENKAPSGEGKVEERLVREIPKLLPNGGTVIDLGTEKGINALYLAGLAEGRFTVTAWDIDPDNVDELNRLAKEKGLSIQTEARNIRELSDLDPDHHFDVFVCTYVLHHLTRQDAPLLIKEMQERTNRGGLNVIATFTEDGDFYRDPKNTGNFYLHNARELRDLYTDAGWEILEPQIDAPQEVRVKAKQKRQDGSKSQMENMCVKLIAIKKEH